MTSNTPAEALARQQIIVNKAIELLRHSASSLLEIDLENATWQDVSEHDKASYLAAELIRSLIEKEQPNQ